MNNSFWGNDVFSRANSSYDDFLNTSNNTNSIPITPNMGNWNNTNNGMNNSYAQGILKKNIGMTGYFFVSFPDSVDWRDKIFYGVLTDAGDDYILIYNEDNNEYYLIWSIYLNYATFDRRPNTN